MSRLARPLHPLALSVAMALAAVPLLTVQSSFAEESSAQRGFQVPAGDLSQALNNLAEQAGLVLAFDAELTRGKRSPGVSGQYDIDGALNQLLAGTGLQALKLSGDRYRLEAVPDDLRQFDERPVPCGGSGCVHRPGVCGDGAVPAAHLPDPDEAAGADA